MIFLIIILLLSILDFMSSFNNNMNMNMNNNMNMNMNNNMNIKLYAYDISNYCSSIKIALQYKELDYSEIPPPDGYGSIEYKKIVHMGTIPALVITNNNNDDFVISESQVILEYLDQKFPHTKPLFLASINLL